MYNNKNNDEELINAAITLAEDEVTVIYKNDITNVRQVNIDASHTATHKDKITIRQRGMNMGNAFSTETQSIIKSIKRDGKLVQFRRNPTIATLYNDNNATMLTYNSGADRHHLGQ